MKSLVLTLANYAHNFPYNAMPAIPGNTIVMLWNICYAHIMLSYIM